MQGLLGVDPCNVAYAYLLQLTISVVCFYCPLSSSPRTLSLAQERGSLQQSQLSAFLSRSVPLHQLLGPSCKKAELLQQVQDFLAEHKQVRCTCHSVSPGHLSPSLLL